MAFNIVKTLGTDLDLTLIKEVTVKMNDIGLKMAESEAKMEEIGRLYEEEDQQPPDKCGTITDLI